jgi:hypothetical protein
LNDRKKSEREAFFWSSLAKSCHTRGKTLPHQ